MKPKIEDLRKKAFLLYGGHDGVEAVTKEVKKFGIPEDQLNDYQLKIILNNIIKNVFIDKVGIEQTKEILAQRITNVPGYHAFVELSQEKTVITSRIDFMKTLAKVLAIFMLVVIALFWSYMKSFDPLEVCELKETKNLKDECYKGVAINSKNHTICGKLSDKEDTYTCFYVISMATRDYTVCDGIPTNVPEYYVIYNKCMRCMANMNRNSTLCSKLLGIYDRTQCMDAVRGEMSVACVP